MLKVMLGIGALVLVPVIGTTLAANITVNGSPDSTTEFAQGQTGTTGCDLEVLIAAKSDYVVNYFRLDTVTVSNFDFSACTGKTIILSAANDSGTDIGLTIDTEPIKRASIVIGGASAGSYTVTCSDAAFTCSKNDAETAFTVKIASSGNGNDSTTVNKFLIQSS